MTFQVLPINMYALINNDFRHYLKLVWRFSHNSRMSKMKFDCRFVLSFVFYRLCRRGFKVVERGTSRNHWLLRHDVTTKSGKFTR